MGVVVGLGIAIGLLLIGSRGQRRHVSRPPLAQSLLDRAGLSQVTPGSLLLASVLCAAAAGFLALALTGIALLGLFALLAGGLTPWALARRRSRRRQREVQAAWPDAVDVLAAGVRAGLSLPEAVGELPRRGPEPLREQMDQVARSLGRGATFGDAMDEMSSLFADPVSDRIAETLRIAHDVGGRDINQVLRTLSEFLREEHRTRGEIASRQSWTINSARIAVAAPWATLVIMSLRPGTVEAYQTAAGGWVLAGAAALSVAAYALMLRIAALPTEIRMRQTDPAPASGATR